MSYLLNEILLYVIVAAGIGAAVGWFIRHRQCGMTVDKMQTNIDESKAIIDNRIKQVNSYKKLHRDLKSRLDSRTKQVNSYKKLYRYLTSELETQKGDLKLMTSRWQELLLKAKELPKYQSWLSNVQDMYRRTLSERDCISNLADQNAAMHSEAVKKIKRLNERVTNQEKFKFRLDDMIIKVGNLNAKVTTSENDMRSLYGMVNQIQKKWRKDRSDVIKFRAANDDMISKVRRLNDKVTNSENDIRGLYGMVSQVQSKWRQDRVDTIMLRDLHPKLEEKTYRAQWKLAELDKKYTEEIHELKAQHKTTLEELNVEHKSDVEKLNHRIDELTPLEGGQPSHDTKFNRFMDKIRLVGTSKNSVLGRTYNKIEEIKLEASEKERVFVDTCEEKDAIIDDLREQIRTADNRAQAAYSAQLQENNAKVHSLEKEITTLNKSAALLREHEHTIDALKTKLKALDTSKTEPKSVEESLTKNTNTKTKSKTNLESAFSAPAKGLKIAAAKVKDELQTIKGIGPKMEKTLNEFGIYSFEQLANLAKDDIKMLADKLGGFPGRIDRDKWVSQSKKHLKKKYGI